MVDLSLLPIATAQAKEESKSNPGKIFLLFWDGVDEFGIVPEENAKLFINQYPKSSILGKYLNGKMIE